MKINMEYNLMDENGQPIDKEILETNQIDKVNMALYLRNELYEKMEEITEDLSCEYKHHVMENAIFNLWREQLIILCRINKQYAKNIVYDDIKIIKNIIINMEKSS